MIGLRIALLTLSLLIALPYVPLRAAEIEGVRFTDSVRVADRQLVLNGKPLGTVPGNDFASAIFSVWLGEDPIDRGFRDTLLATRSR